MIFPRVDEPIRTLARSVRTRVASNFKGCIKEKAAMGTVVAIDDRFRVAIGMEG
jgi:hypothetical protein